MGSKILSHTPYRSFLVMSRAEGFVLKWPDPRESSPLVLFDGQEIPCHSVCLVAPPKKDLPLHLLNHLAPLYPSSLEIRPWELPEDNSD